MLQPGLLSVFVYGTLRRGESNHALLAPAEPQRTSLTRPEYTLVSFGEYPALVEGGSTSVVGEVYLIDEHTLTQLDELEEHPDYYVRRSIQLADGDRVLTYVLPAEHAAGSLPLTSGDWKQRG